MTNIDGLFSEFISEHVKLSGDVKNKLKEKKRLNVQRIKDGLKEYNLNHFKEIRLAEEPLIQGSVGMSTTIQNSKNEFDIDVSLIFEHDDIPECTTDAKNVILEVLKYSSKKFAKAPEVKKNCITIYYAEGFHVDLAVYRRSKKNKFKSEYYYEHCGENWSERNPRAIQMWFSQEVTKKKFLREHVRLIKMYCQKNKGNCEFPGGLILSVLLNESYTDDDSFEKSFYKTLKKMSKRLVGNNEEVLNPTNEQNLIKNDKDKINVMRFTVALNHSINDISALDGNLNDIKGKTKLWNSFFKHKYWENPRTTNSTRVSKDTTQKISDFYPISRKNTGKFVLICKVYKDGIEIEKFDSTSTESDGSNRLLKKELEKGLELRFQIVRDEKNNNIVWKVKNTGREAIENDDLRGNLLFENSEIRTENTRYSGSHYVEAYQIKQGECVNIARININIE